MKKFCIWGYLSIFVLISYFVKAEESSDYKFINMNLMYGVGMENPYLSKNDQYLLLENSFYNCTTKKYSSFPFNWKSNRFGFEFFNDSMLLLGILDVFDLI